MHTRSKKSSSERIHSSEKAYTDDTGKAVQHRRFESNQSPGVTITKIAPLRGKATEGNLRPPAE